MATNKNQHFVPRCYLKAFTVDGENAAINLVNIDRERAIPGVPVKNQCSGDYFYGQDNQLEEAIRRVEGAYSALIPRIQAPGYLLTDDDRTTLRIFMLFQHMRTEAASRRSVEMFAGMETAAGAPFPGIRPSIKEAVQLAMRTFSDTMHALDDLKVCLVRNRTSRPFITSDDPAVVANRWFQQDSRVRHRSFGSSSCGALVFLPLTPKIQCIAYDGDIYSIPNTRGWTETRSESDIVACNEQQILNAVANVYFREWADRDWTLENVKASSGRRIEARHRVTYAVWDGVHNGSTRYRVVERFDSEEHEEAIMHSEALNPTPAHWPTLLRWRPKGSVFCNGTGTGYKRAGQISPWGHQDYWREPSGH